MQGGRGEHIMIPQVSFSTVDAVSLAKCLVSLTQYHEKQILSPHYQCMDQRFWVWLKLCVHIYTHIVPPFRNLAPTPALNKCTQQDVSIPEQSLMYSTVYGTCDAYGTPIN